jgi:hypothetical protein
MPTYEFECLSCTEKIKEIKSNPENINNEDIQNCPDNYTFEIEGCMSNPPHEAECPVCEVITNRRVFFPAYVHWGLTAAEKSAGTTKGRFDMGKFMKDARDKRKRQAAPDSKDKISNELWTNTPWQKDLLKDIVPDKIK